MTDSITVTREQVEREVEDFFRSEFYVSVSGALVYTNNISTDPNQSVKDLAQSFTTALFNNVKEGEEAEKEEQTRLDEE